jgi:glycosyltransferase 2 family protein
MKKHFATVIVIIILVALVYLQFRTWKSFDWVKFRQQTENINLLRILLAVACVYSVYVLRAIRWKIFLKPVRDVRSRELVPSQVIGFTGLALLGRPGEFIRPYLIARKYNLSLASQLAVWTVERIFDICTVAILLGINLFLYFPQYTKAGIIFIILAAGLASVAFLLWLKTEAIANIIHHIIGRFSPRIASSVCERVRSFGEGLHTIHDVSSFFQLLALSVGVWILVATSYLQVAHAYPSLQHMALHHVLLIMGSSMAGSIIQLPGVGGGSQLAVISILASPIFALSKELAVSCGIMLWLVTFVSVTPLGLFLAHRERISLRQLSEESQVAEHTAS